jgi:hypothetical protein
VRVNSGREIVAEEVSNRPGINKTDLLDAVRARIPGPGGRQSRRSTSRTAPVTASCTTLGRARSNRSLEI